MKIGIATVWNANNNGSFLQAYALQKYIEQLGHEVKMLKLADFAHGGTEYSDTFWNNLEGHHSLLNVSEDLSEEFDVIVYGSDEIWSMFGELVNPIFWGYGLNAKHKITYAVSAQNLNIKSVLTHPFTYLGIRKFDKLSVRDKVSQKKLSYLTRKSLSMVLDPTFLISYDSCKTENTIGKYQLVYTYGLDAENAKNIRRFADEKGLKIVCTGSDRPSEWGDINIPAGPFEWIGLIHNAEYIVSSTFHGTVFSIICKKQFFVVGTNSGKVKDLLERTGLCYRKTTDFYQQESIDYKQVYNRLDKEISFSKDFLKAALI